jgi:hypothetical protein
MMIREEPRPLLVRERSAPAEEALVDDPRMTEAPEMPEALTNETHARLKPERSGQPGEERFQVEAPQEEVPLIYRTPAGTAEVLSSETDGFAFAAVGTTGHGVPLRLGAEEPQPLPQPKQGTVGTGHVFVRDVGRIMLIEQAQDELQAGPDRKR